MDGANAPDFSNAHPPRNRQQWDPRTTTKHCDNHREPVAECSGKAARWRPRGRHQRLGERMRYGRSDVNSGDTALGGSKECQSPTALYNLLKKAMTVKSEQPRVRNAKFTYTSEDMRNEHATKQSRKSAGFQAATPEGVAPALATALEGSTTCCADAAVTTPTVVIQSAPVWKTNRLKITNQEPCKMLRAAQPHANTILARMANLCASAPGEATERLQCRECCGSPRVWPCGGDRGPALHERDRHGQCS